MNVRMRWTAGLIPVAGPDCGALWRRLCFGIARQKSDNVPGYQKAVYGMLAGKTDVVATIEEMNEAIARGWAGLK